MGISPAMNSSLSGLQAAQAQMTRASSTIAGGDELLNAEGAPVNTGSTGDAVADLSSAQVLQQVNLTMLRREMDAQKSIIDILA
jgi:hypothetical protein